MHPTFKDGELLLFYKLNWEKQATKKPIVNEGDVVLASVKIDKSFGPLMVVKRVVNVKKNSSNEVRHFVLHGDNLQESIDSRHPSFGVLREDCIVGKFLKKLND